MSQSAVLPTREIPIPASDIRPNKIEVEPVWLDQRGVCKRFRWDDAAFAAAIGLPAPTFPLASRRREGGEWVPTLVWRADALDAWAAEARAHRAVLERLVTI